MSATTPAAGPPGSPIIVHRGEFIDVLRALARGHVLVRTSPLSGRCTIDGGMVYHSYHTLTRYGLVAEFDNPEGFPAVQYLRLTQRGREFAARACEAWRQRPWLERLATRLVG